MIVEAGLVITLTDLPFVCVGVGDGDGDGGVKVIRTGIGLCGRTVRALVPGRALVRGFMR